MPVSSKANTPPKLPPTAMPQAGPKAAPKAPTIAKANDDKLAFVVVNLKQRGNSKPRTLKTRTSTIGSLYPKGMSKSELASLLQKLQSAGKVIVKENKVTYAL